MARTITLEMPDSVEAVYQRLQRLAEIPDNARLFATALIVYHQCLIEKAQRDAELVLRYPDGSEKQLDLFPCPPTEKKKK